MQDEPVASKPKRSSFKRFLITFVIVLLLGLGTFVYWKYYFTYSEGNRSGLLQKFSHKGNIFKTYEGELILSSIKSTANTAIASEKFLFSVDDKILAKRMIDMEGEWVTLHYKQKNGILPWRGETEYLVDSVVKRGQ
ncbi:MAG: hypothetical protein JSU05_04025 [Bacteroidetes bacterium]|nr:hypothetical protein [Bacteroidota bacterium]